MTSKVSSPTPSRNIIDLGIVIAGRFSLTDLADGRVVWTGRRYADAMRSNADQIGVQIATAA